MKQVWKCDFCSTTGESMSAMMEHEEKCSWNPANKTCAPCKHRTEEGAPISGYWWGCDDGVDYDTRDAVAMGSIDCDKWVIENES